MKEYGGCLHFEIGGGKEYYHSFTDCKVDVDSGRSALQYIMDNYNYKRIWLPVYNCPLVGKRIADTSDIQVVWYNLNDDFSPQITLSDFQKGDVILWVNYCGVMSQVLINQIAALQDKTPADVIIDNIPAYFSAPIMKVFNLYSCRKFLGVPDGGHVIREGIKKETLSTYNTSENYLYLMKAIEEGSNAAYADYQLSESRFAEAKTAYGMPVITRKILKGMNYEHIKQKRFNNFSVLHQKLYQSNRLVFDTNSQTPSVYPYLTSNCMLREYLLENKIYVSTFWKHVLTNKMANNFEKDLAKFLIPLPIDQRYDSKDMEYIAEMILSLD